MRSLHKRVLPNYLGCMCHNCVPDSNSRQFVQRTKNKRFRVLGKQEIRMADYEYYEPAHNLVEASGKPVLTKDTYTQSEVDSMATAFRNSITGAGGTEKVYTRAEVQKILDAIEANPKHRQRNGHGSS